MLGFKLFCYCKAIIYDLNNVLLKFFLYYSQCTDPTNKDKIVIGGSNGLDTTNLQAAQSICGSGSMENVEHVVLCAITSVRLESSGKNNNKVIVSLREAVENDLDKASAVCDL